MTAIIPPELADLFQKKALAHLATVMPDGTPQVTPVWVDYDGRHVLVNSARGRQKDRNMRANAAVALSLCDPDDPFRYLEVRGRVVEITERGADAHIDRLAHKYLGVERYPFGAPGKVRVIYRIEPTHTTQLRR